MKRPPRYLRYLPFAIGGVLVALIGVGVFFLQDMFEKPAQTKKMVQQVTLIQPPPPPPPPPPLEKPPEPEVKQEKIEEPEPEKEPDKAPEKAEEPPSEQLGVDGEGGAGSDAFGLAARKGGRSLLGGSPGSVSVWYGGQVSKAMEKELDRLLQDNNKARQASYSVILSVWIGSDGRVTRAEMNGSSGKPEVDAEIRSALAKLSLGLDRPPPEEMPQPVKIRVTSRL